MTVLKCVQSLQGLPKYRAELHLRTASFVHCCIHLSHELNFTYSNLNFKPIPLSHQTSIHCLKYLASSLQMAFVPVLTPLQSQAYHRRYEYDGKNVRMSSPDTPPRLSRRTVLAAAATVTLAQCTSIIAPRNANAAVSIDTDRFGDKGMRSHPLFSSLYMLHPYSVAKANLARFVYRFECRRTQGQRNQQYVARESFGFDSTCFYACEDSAAVR